MKRFVMVFVVMLAFGTACGGSGSKDSGGTPGGGGAPAAVIDCVAPWVVLDLADGTQVLASDVRPGDLVWTIPEAGGEYGAYAVEEVRPGSAPLYAVNLFGLLDSEDPVLRHRSLQFSATHELLVDGRGWVKVQDLAEGDVIMGRIPHRVESTAELYVSVVVQISVAGARTFESWGVTSRAPPLAD